MEFSTTVRKSIIRQKLTDNEPVLVTTLHLASPAMFELASLMGFDGLWIDVEHHSFSLETVETLMRAARVGRSDIVARPAKGEFMRMARLLEAGAQGIMYPRCESAAEAAEVVKWAKFPPLGKRGCDGGGPDMPYCTKPTDRYLREANEQTFIVIQIEDEEAIDHVEEIAAVDGVDVLMLGPGDFSSLGGFAGQMDHPRLERATERIAAAALASGKHWGRPLITPDEASLYLSMGAMFLPYSSDLRILKEGWEAIQRRFLGEGFTFDNQVTPVEACNGVLVGR